MTPERGVRSERNIRLFKSDLKKLLEERDKPISIKFVWKLLTRWNLWGQDIDPILTNMGWQKSMIDETPMLIPIPRPEPESSTISVKYRPPEQIIVSVIPRAHRHMALPNGDGEVPGSMDDGHHHLNDEEYYVDDGNFHDENDI